ncbi:hypothetical protein [Nocardioides pakistanensis]
MTVSEWPTAPSAQVVDLTARLSEAEAMNEVLEESLADLELAAEDRGWQRLSADLDRDFSRAGLQRIATNCRIMAIASPMVKRALNLRIGYIWGQGVTLTGRDEDVNEVVQAWWDDESNQAALTSSQAQEELERALGTDGNVFLACFTAPRTGRVQVRSTPFDEIQDIISNPEDRDDPWFYVRQYTTTVVEPGYSGQTRTRTETRRVLHPDLRYRPRMRPRSINGIPVQWDAPILHVSVNRLDGWKFGIGDAYAALPWARAYDGFLTDWAKLVKALSRFAWRLTGDKSSRARKAASAVRAAQPVDGAAAPVGGVAAGGPGVHLEAIPKSGATIDSESGKPLASLVAAGMGVPVTMLLADPGQTGARAVAETLDDPLILEMGMRRQLWASVLRRLTSYVVDQAVKAPAGPLRGIVGRDEYDREVITLAGDVERTVDVDWPPLDDLDPKSLVEAIERADAVGAPKAVLIRLLLQALRVKDVDEILQPFLDDEGRWVDPDATAGQAAVDAFRRGQDPAEALR